MGIKTKCGFYNYSDNENETDVKKELPAKEKQNYIDNIIKRLQHLYLNSAFNIIEKSYCNKEDLEFAVKEYMGVEKGPFALAKEINYI